MKSDTQTAKGVAKAVISALKNAPLRQATLEFEGATLFLSKGGKFPLDPQEGEDVPNYPAVASTLRDDNDSWFK